MPQTDGQTILLLAGQIKLSATAYSQGDFAQALQIAKKLFPQDQARLQLFTYANSNTTNSIRRKPFPFLEPKKLAKEQTYLQLYSPVAGRYVYGQAEERIEGSAIEWRKPDPDEHVKVSAKAADGSLYILTLSGGWRTGFKPGLYSKAAQLGLNSRSPAIAFNGAGTFKYGQFMVYQVEWTDAEKKTLSRLAVDFLGSGTGDTKDVCYGKLRYRSNYE